MAELWPFRPTIGTSETLEWMTDVLSSKTGEQRICLRSVPRQIFEYSAVINEDDFARAKQFAKRNAALQVKIPIWVECTELGFSLFADDTTIDFNTTTGDYRVGSDIIIWDSNSDYMLATIAALTSTRITLTDNLGTSFANPTVAPIKIAWATEGYKSLRESNWANLGGTFLVTNNIALTWTSDYPQYLGLDVVTEETLSVSDINEDIVSLAEYVDSGFGPVVAEPMKNYIDFGQTLGFVEYGADRLRRRRRWLHSLRGKQKCFWLPSFNQDMNLRLTITAAATTIRIDKIGEIEQYHDQHIMIELKSGAHYFRKITNATHLLNDIDQLTINAAFGIVIAATDIRFFSFISKVRLDTDSVKIDYLETGISTISIPVTEVSDDI